MTTDVLRATGLHKTFVDQRSLLGRPTSRVHAVRGVDVSVQPGETLAVVGESGSGKSTLGRLLLRLIEPDEGSVTFQGLDVLSMGSRELRHLRARMRMIFQDPFSSLDTKMVVGDAVAEPLTIHEGLRRDERRERVSELFRRVGLANDHLDRYPYEFSGGQLQRVAIARAIATEPVLLVCDEPVAALDMSIRAQVLNLLQHLQEELGMAYVFISHDLSLVRLVADRIAIMYAGHVVETGPTDEIFSSPRHPYTQGLVDAIPVPDPRRRRLRVFAGQWKATNAPGHEGCVYAGRCPQTADVCRTTAPQLLPQGSATEVACHLHDPDVVHPLPGSEANTA